MKTYWLQFGSGDPRVFTALTPTFIYWYNGNGATLAAPGITQVLAGSGQFQFQWSPTFPISFIADGGSGATVGRYVGGALDPADLINETGQTLISMGTTLTAIGTTNVALGNTNVALGTLNFALGTTNVGIGITGQAIGITTQQYAILNNALGTTGVALGTTGVAIGTTALGFGMSTYAIASSLSFGVSQILEVLGTTASSIGTTSTNPGDIFGEVKRIHEFLEGNAGFDKTTGLWSVYSRGSSTLLVVKTLTNTVSSANKS